MLSGEVLGLLGEVEPAWSRSERGDGVAWRGRSWRPSSGSGTRASRSCSQRGRQGGKPWELEGGLVGGAARTGGVAGVRPGHRQGAGRREVEEAVSGSFVIFSKFKNPVM